MQLASSPLARKVVKELMLRPYNPDMFAAHVSFCEGVGAFTYAKSQVLIAHNNQDYVQAIRGFVLPWTSKVDGETKDWLVDQRKEEQACYEAGLEKLWRADPEPEPEPDPEPTLPPLPEESADGLFIGMFVVAVLILLASTLSWFVV